MQNQVAGSGSSCVNILHWIFEEAYNRQGDIESLITVLVTIALSKISIFLIRSPSSSLDFLST